jgi:hypothetical protein
MNTKYTITGNRIEARDPGNYKGRKQWFDTPEAAALHEIQQETQRLKYDEERIRGRMERIARLRGLV